MRIKINKAHHATKNVGQPSKNDAFKRLGIDSMLLHPVP